MEKKDESIRNAPAADIADRHSFLIEMAESSDDKLSKDLAEALKESHTHMALDLVRMTQLKACLEVTNKCTVRLLEILTMLDPENKHLDRELDENLSASSTSYANIKRDMIGQRLVILVEVLLRTDIDSMADIIGSSSRSPAGLVEQVRNLRTTLKDLGLAKKPGDPTRVLADDLDDRHRMIERIMGLLDTSTSATKMALDRLKERDSILGQIIGERDAAHANLAKVTDLLDALDELDEADAELQTAIESGDKAPVIESRDDHREAVLGRLIAGLRAYRDGDDQPERMRRLN